MTDEEIISLAEEFVMPVPSEHAVFYPFTREELVDFVKSIEDRQTISKKA